MTRIATLQTFLFCATVILPVPALANWTYSPSGGPAGSASVAGSDGSTLIVDCGNSGEIGIVVQPDIRPSSMRQANSGFLGFVIDGNPVSRINVPVSCEANQCSTGGRPGVLPLVRALQAGSTAQIWWEDWDLGVYSLAGSSAAIGKIKAAGCPGF